MHFQVSRSQFQKGFAVVVGTVIICFWVLSFNAFCFRDGEFASDRMLIDAAIRYETQGSEEVVGSAQEISPEQFRALFGDACCAVYREGPGFGLEGALLNSVRRCFGNYLAVVELRYTPHNVDGHNTKRESELILNACGDVIEWKSIEE